MPVAKCIVCNKSAGPFYSLHKSCYQVYQDTRECIRQVFSKSIESCEQTNKFTSSIEECKPSTFFSQSLFDSLVKREWQDQANRIVKSKELKGEDANYLLDIAPVLEIEDKNVEPHLFTRLSNIEHLERFQQMESIADVFSGAQIDVELENDESLIWIFKETLDVEQSRFSPDSEWTVFQSILNSLFKKSRYKELEVKVESAGKLIITNQFLHYVTNKDASKIAYSEIYSITPLKDGVRIQTTKRDSTPNTYITGDGRFTYTLIRYATDQQIQN